MSQLSFRQLWNVLSTGTLIAVGLLLAGPNGPARAGPIFDPLGDFLPTYTGAQDAGLDVLAHEVTLVGDRLNFFGRMAGPIAPTQAVGGLYLIGVDRGLGTPRFLNSPAAPPTIGPNVKWDAIVRILPDGTGFYLNSLLGVTTPLPTSDISIIGNEFNVSIPVSLMLPSATKPPEEWTYNLWPRNGVGLNVQVSDLAPDDGNSPVHVVPEPASLALLALGLPILVGRISRKFGSGRVRRARRHALAVENFLKRYVFLLAAFMTVVASVTAEAAAIIDVDFNDGLIPSGAFVIDDTATGVHVVPSAGNLNDTPLLLTGTATGLAAVAFYFPQVSEGRYDFSWDSLVLTLQPEDKDIVGWDHSFIALLARSPEGYARVPWSLEYDASGQMLLGCCDSAIPVSATAIGAYVHGQSDHFELSVNLDSDTYRLKVNGELKVTNEPLLFGAVNGILFESPGRAFLQDPAALAVDNIKVELIPEPASIALLALGLPLLVRRNSRKLGTGEVPRTRRFALATPVRAVAVVGSDH